MTGWLESGAGEVSRLQTRCLQEASWSPPEVIFLHLLFEIWAENIPIFFTSSEKLNLTVRKLHYHKFSVCFKFHCLWILSYFSPSLSPRSSRNCPVSLWRRGNKCTLPFCPLRLEMLVQIPNFLPDLARQERSPFHSFALVYFTASAWRETQQAGENKRKKKSERV